MPDFNLITDAWEALTVLRPGYPYHRVGDNAEALAAALADDGPDRRTLRTYHRELVMSLLEWAGDAPDVAPGDLWQQYVVWTIVDGEHPLGQRTAAGMLPAVGVSSRELAAADLAAMQQMYGFTSRAVQAALREHGISEAPSWDDGAALDPLQIDAPLCRAFHFSQHWPDLLEPLLERFRTQGAGRESRYAAFRWDTEDGLVGIDRPDPIAMDDLVGYEYARQTLVRNTEQFLGGLPCNNILLYGARGTGKSSLIKALLNAYRGRGLRLVEVAREDMKDFPRIVRLLRSKPQRFVLFADDLSYDDSELHYRELKAALEGTVEGRPENVLLYATSNRRHLIKERFRDRDQPDDEIHAHDTVQEKLSLSDRFGLTLSFAPPTQAEYLKMVESIVSRRGLQVDPVELRAAALRWVALHNLPSGRTARQFVDDMEGSMRVQ